MTKRTIQEIQAAIKAHHEQAEAQSVPLCFRTLAVLQNELNEALVAASGQAQGDISDEQAAFNTKVRKALFDEDGLTVDAPKPPAPDAPAAEQAV